MVSDRNDSPLVVLTGSSGAGKTWLCTQVVMRHRASGRDIAGVLTLPRLAGGDKIGMVVQDVRTGERRPLAERRTGNDGPTTESWHFHSDGLSWGACVLGTIDTCDLLVIDELGPLELKRGAGWIAGLTLLRAHRYRRALVVVRPALLPEFADLFPETPYQILAVTRAGQDECLDRIAAWLAPAADVGGTP